MHPILFTLHIYGHDWTIMSYSFFYIIAVFFVLIGSFVAVLRNGFSRFSAVVMLTFMAFFGFIGARLLHFVLNPSVYSENYMQLFDLHMTGFTIVGGLIFAIGAGAIVGKKLKIDIWFFADNIVPYVGFGIMIARIGCFLNGCCFGHVTAIPWGSTFPLLSFAHIHQISQGLGNIFFVAPVHPTQIYEMIAAGIGGIISLLIIRKNIFPGAAILFFGMWFSLFRLGNMFFRQMPGSLILSQNQYSLVYISIFIFCAILFTYQLKR